MAISGDNSTKTPKDRVITAIYAALLQQDSMTYHTVGDDKPMLERAEETAEEIYGILGISEEE